MDTMTTPPQPDFELPLPPPEAQPVAAAPETPTPTAEIVAALRTIDPLDGLTETEYTWLASHGTERKGQAGALIFREGETACNLNFILTGETHVRRKHAGPLAMFIGRAGQMTGKLPFSRMKAYGGDGYAVSEVWTLDIHQDLFPAMLDAIPSMAQRSVSVLLDRVREVTRMEQQAEKLNALGKLAANLAHELNNPASAAQRSAASLFTELRQYGEQTFQIGALKLPAEQMARMKQWMAGTRRSMAEYGGRKADPAGALELADREEVFARWLGAQKVDNPWEAAPSLAEATITLAQLEELLTITGPQVFPLCIKAFTSSLRVERRAETVVDSTVRIFDLISAIKDYSYMDQAPIQEIDLAQSLENTLAMFHSRLENIAVQTRFDPELPPISAYGSELNQVWTALIENAIDAMLSEPAGASGTNRTLSLATRLAGQMAFVEIANTGPGIPPHLQSRIFEPFFTTKPPGHGLGLGLDTAQRIVSKHSGFLTVESRPGYTCFQARLPVERAEAY